MFRPTSALHKQIRRLPLSTKQAGKEYYKGNRVGSMGSIDKFGRFTPDWSKVRTYVYPTMGTQNSELTPFVAASIEKTSTGSRGYMENYPKNFTGEDYLKAWKLGGGHDLVFYDGAEAQSQPARNMPEVSEDRSAKV